MTSSIGIRIPVMPTGIASETQMTQAHITTARQALPAGDRPCGVGSAYNTKKNRPQASPNPRTVVKGLRPDSAMLWRKRPANPFVPLRRWATTLLPLSDAIDAKVSVVDLPIFIPLKVRYQ